MRTIRRGDTGSSVSLCQQRLLDKGYVLPKYGVDGDFGGETESAVYQFQAAQHLVVDGIVGDKTWDALLAGDPVAPPDDALEEQRDELRALYQSQIDRVPLTMRDAVSRTCDAAIDDLGCVEVPNGSNGGPEIDHIVGGYNQYWWVLNDEADLATIQARGYVLPDECAAPMPWCGMATSSWVQRGLMLANWDLMGFAIKLVGLPFHQFFGGPTPYEDWARDEGYPIMNPVGVEARPGDIFTMGGQSGSDSGTSSHIGMVIGQNQDGSLVTMEGNVSNSVGSRTRQPSDLRWLIRWYMD